MDTKKLFITMLVGTVLFFGYMRFIAPQPKAEKPVEKTGTGLVGSGGAAAPVGAGVREVGQFEESRTKQLGGCNAGDKYHLAVEIANETGGINWVRLNAKEYTETAKDHNPFALLWTNPGETRAFATKAITINGTKIDMLKRGDGQPVTWKFVPSDKADEVRMRFTVEAAGKPFAQIEKVFTIKDASTYEVEISHEVTNLSGEKMEVTIEQYGPTSLPFDDVRSDPRNYQGAAYRTSGKYIDAEKGPLVMQAVFTAKEKPVSKDVGEFGGKADPLVWVAASDRFFTAIVRPLETPGCAVLPLEDNKRSISAPDFLGVTTVDRVDHEEGERAAVHFGGKAVTVGAGLKTALATNVFLGPKSRHLLTGVYAEKAVTPANYYELYKYKDVIHVAQGGGCAPCAVITSTRVAYAILGLLDMLNVVTHNYGVAIIILVLVVRLLLHPLTRYSQVNMAKMQKKMADFQPEMERLKKKYAKDKAQLNVEMMKLYKEKKINPAGGLAGCLPMFIQMPIWIALYAGLAIDIDLRHAGFIPGWIVDLSAPDTVVAFGHSVSLGIMEINGINLLPILLIGVFFVQMKMQMRNMPAPADEQQAQTQKMTQYMSLLFPIFLYNAPSGLNVYIFASTIGGLFDQWLVRKHLRAEGLIVEKK